MAHLIQAPTRLEAWITAVDYLQPLQYEATLDLILSIANPGTDGPQGSLALQTIDNFLREEDQKPIHTVAETIFPAWAYKRRGLRGLREKYLAEEFPRMKESHPTYWGIYAERILERKLPGGKTMRPLERVIEKLRDEASKPGPKTACCELNVVPLEFEIPLYEATKDDHRRMGLPCLSHLSFRLWDHKVHLLAVYRSHCYRYKVVGNLLGLTRLLACVCHESSLKMGGLTIHSSYATLGGAKGRMSLLLKSLRSLAGTPAAVSQSVATDRSP